MALKVFRVAVLLKALEQESSAPMLSSLPWVSGDDRTNRVAVVEYARFEALGHVHSELFCSVDCRVSLVLWQRHIRESGLVSEKIGELISSDSSKSLASGSLAGEPS